MVFEEDKLDTGVDMKKCYKIPSGKVNFRIVFAQSISAGQKWQLCHRAGQTFFPTDLTCGHHD